MEGTTLVIQKLRSVKTPSRGTPKSAGLDFYLPDTSHAIVGPWRDALIPLGIRVMLPEGTALIFKEKSGIATKMLLDVMACVVDEDYRGEVHAHLFNNSDREVVFKGGDKLVQGLVVPVIYCDVIEGEIDVDTIRGQGGFGSTGNT